MPTQQSVHAALDTAAATALSGTPIAFENVNYDELSSGEIPFVSVTVNFRSNSQFELGRPTFGRTKGAIFFIIHIRKGTGTAARDSLQTTIQAAFRSQLIGGATLFNAKIINLGEDKQWAKTGIEIPFQFED